MLRQNTKTASVLFMGPALVREVEMEVVFGTPSKNCAGAGVCMLTNRFTNGHTVPCPHAPAIVHFPPGGNRELVFRFRKRYLTERILSGYFSSEFFVVEEAFRLPLQMVRRLGLPVRSIRPGRYVLEEYTREWRLYFPF